MERKIHNHGDLILRPVDGVELPTATLQKIVVLQDSGPTGNRHEVVGEIAHWTTEDGKEYVHCATPFILQHVGGDCEHGVQDMEAGTWEVLHELEHDPWTNELKIVID